MQILEEIIMDLTGVPFVTSALSWFDEWFPSEEQIIKNNQVTLDKIADLVSKRDLTFPNHKIVTKQLQHIKAELVQQRFIENAMFYWTHDTTIGDLPLLTTQLAKQQSYQKALTGVQNNQETLFSAHVLQLAYALEDRSDSIILENWMEFNYHLYYTNLVQQAVKVRDLFEKIHQQANTDVSEINKELGQEFVKQYGLFVGMIEKEIEYQVIARKMYEAKCDFIALPNIPGIILTKEKENPNLDELKKAKDALDTFCKNNATTGYFHTLLAFENFQKRVEAGNLVDTTIDQIRTLSARDKLALLIIDSLYYSETLPYLEAGWRFEDQRKLEEIQSTISGFDKIAFKLLQFGLVQQGFNKLSQSQLKYVSYTSPYVQTQVQYLSNHTIPVLVEKILEANPALEDALNEA